MTSSFRRIDLLTKILAPIVTGQVMTFAGLKVGCGFIAGWSAISLGVEYCLIRRVYNIVPALKMNKCRPGYSVVSGRGIQVKTEESSSLENDKLIEAAESNQADTTDVTTTITTDSITPITTDATATDAISSITTDATATDAISSITTDATTTDAISSITTDATSYITTDAISYIAPDAISSTATDAISYIAPDAISSITTNRRHCNGTCCLRQLLSSFLVMYRGLTTYFSCSTKWAGLALACLYLTVLGFDDITVGYATMQGLTGSVLGIMMGVGACFGVLATFTYPFIVRKLGLPVTGVFALGLQVSCLTLCVVSVWLPGSPFDPFFAHNLPEMNTKPRNCSIGLHNNTRHMNDTNDRMLPEHQPFCIDEVSQPGHDHSLSVWIMISGIVLARFGLWTADLTTVQLFLENVAPGQRGIINGFQTSLNQLMDFVKYALVMVLPRPQQFGLLVFISYAFICTGWVFMGVNAMKTAKRRRDEGIRDKQFIHTNKTTIFRRRSKY